MRITQQEAQSIVDEMKASIHRDINIMNESGMILASTNPARRGRLHQGALRIIREGLSSLTIWRDEPEQGVQRGINLPVTIKGHLEGVIGITGDPREVSAFGDVIKRMTEIMLEGLYQREQSDLLDRARGLFVESWLFSGEPDWAELELRGRLLGLDINAPYTVALLEPVEKGERRPEMHSSLLLRMIRDHFQESGGHFCAVIRSRFIVLLCGMDRKQAFEKIRHICQSIESYRGTRVAAGISGISAGAEDLRRCYLEARTANAVAAQYPAGRVLFYDQVSLEFILESIPLPIRQDVRGLVFSACTPREEKELAETIRLYFDQGGDIQRCADLLFLHRNTFQYRMDRVKRKTGYDLRVPKEGLLLYLAVQLVQGPL